MTQGASTTVYDPSEVILETKIYKNLCVRKLI